jgi:hypothetical protein
MAEHGIVSPAGNGGVPAKPISPED